MQTGLLRLYQVALTPERVFLYFFPHALQTAFPDRNVMGSAHSQTHPLVFAGFP